MNRNNFQEQTSDFEIKVGAASFFVERKVLENASEYFKGLFRSQMRECAKGVIDLKDLDAEGVRQCVRYMENDEIELSPANVKETIVASHELLLCNLTEKCFEFLEDKITTENCISILHWIDVYGEIDANYLDTSLFFILVYFKKVVKTDDFPLIACKYLELFLYFENDAETRTKAMVTWISHDASREKYLPLLIENIDASTIPFDFLTRYILKENFFKKCPRSRRYFVSRWSSDILRVKRQITVENFFAFKSFVNGERHIKNKGQLEVFTQEFLKRNFVWMLDEEYFPTFDKEIFFELFKYRKIRYFPEMAKYVAALRWVKHDPEGRKIYFSELFKEIELKYISPRNRKIIEANPFVNEFTLCKEILAGFETSTSKNSTAGIACVWEYGNKVMALNLTTKKWSKVADVPSSTTCDGIFYVDGDLYIKSARQFFRLGKDECWTEVSPCPVDGKAVVFRGRLTMVGRRKLFKYGKFGNRWATKMPGPDFDNIFCVAASQKFLYAFDVSVYGGEGKQYDYDENEWTALPEMRNARKKFSIVVYDEKLYAIGGKGIVSDSSSTETTGCSVEFYDTRSNAWTVFSPTTRARVYPSACVVGDKLYVIGGDKDTKHGTVEVYRGALGKWEFVRNTPCLRGEMRCCFYHLPNKRGTKRPNSQSSWFHRQSKRRRR